MKRPYLIQRCNIEDIKGKTLDKMLRYDYMGSSEFEFGALFKALTKIANNFDKYKYSMFKQIIHEDGRRICIICPEDFDTEQYIKFLLGVIEKDIKRKELDCSYSYDLGDGFNLSLKEPIYFTVSTKKNRKYNYVDVWWDLDNNVLFTFGKNQCKALFNALENSVKKRLSWVTHDQLTYFHKREDNVLNDYEKVEIEEFNYNYIKDFFELKINDETGVYETEKDFSSYLFCFEQNDPSVRKYEIFKFGNVISNKVYLGSCTIEFKPRHEGLNKTNIPIDIIDFLIELEKGTILIYKK